MVKNNPSKGLQGAGIGPPQTTIGGGGLSPDVKGPMTFPSVMKQNIIGGNNDGHERPRPYDTLQPDPSMRGDTVIMGAGVAAVALVLIGMVVIWKT
jgi:hypothetical protein